MASPVSQADVELFHCPNVASQLPVELDNGIEWTSFDAHCTGCDAVIDHALFRGRVTQPLSAVAVIEAVGYCPQCNLLSRFVHRLHNDARVTFLTRKGWREAHPDRSFIQRCLAALRRLVLAG